MANIDPELQAIREAVYGEEVRGSIVNALEAMNTQAAAAQLWATGEEDPEDEPSETNNAKFYAEQAAESASTLVVDDTLSESGKAADSAAAGNGINQVKNGVISSQIAYTNLSVFASGSIYASGDGGDANNTTRIRSRYWMPLNNIGRFAVDEGYKLMLCVYSEPEAGNESYLGTWNGTVVEKSANFVTDVFTGPLDKALYYRLVLGMVDDSTIADTAEARAAVTEHLHVYSSTDTELETLGVPADALATGDAIRANTAEIEYLEPKVIDLIGVNEDISDQFVFVGEHRIVATSGLYLTVSGSSLTATQRFVDISRYKSLRMTRHKNTTSGGVTGLAFYTAASDSAYLSGDRDSYDPNGGWEERTIDIPEGAKYVRTTYRADYEQPFYCYGIVKGEIEQIWNAIQSSGGSSPEDSIPEYYFDDGYLPDRVAAIADHTKTIGVRSDSLIWFTDPHNYWPGGKIYNSQRGMALMYYVQNHTNIPRVVCGGDILGTSAPQADGIQYLGKWRDFYAPLWDHLYFIIGNHEYNNPSNTAQYRANQIPLSTIYATLIKDKEDQYGSVSEYGDYWFDNTAQKIRYFCIGLNVGALLDAGQVAWFAEELADVPEGYAVVVLSHGALSQPTVEGTTCEITQTTYTYNEQTDKDIAWYKFDNIAALMDAARAGGSVAIPVDPVDGTGYPHNKITRTTYDFSGNEKDVLCAISGHIHFDYDTETDGGIPVVSTTCDRGPYPGSSAEFIQIRPYNSIYEQAFDAVQIDITNRKMYMTRIGGTLVGKTGDIHAAENPDRQFDLPEALV